MDEICYIHNMKYNKTPMDTLKDHALNVATRALTGLTDKANVPMIAHSVRVANLVKTDEEVVVAYLHDVVEDTDYTLDDIRRLFPDWVAKAVDVVTRRDDETYFDYIDRVKRSGDPIALGVKLADIKDHLNRKEAISDSLIKRYEKADKVLREEK